jgi:V8-like Glu-specific endopeptidase
MPYFESVASDIGPPDEQEPNSGNGKARLGGLKFPSALQPSIFTPQYVFEVPDGRTQVGDTTIPPFRAIAYLTIDTGGPNLEYATGWFLSPSVVVTAAHALTFGDGSGATALARSVRVTPGWNGSGPPPFGVYDTTKVVVSSRWPGDPTADFGAVQLAEPVGNTVGWFGFGVFTDAQFGTSSFNAVGYPTVVNNKDAKGTMWGESGPVTPTPSQVLYRMGVSNGQSGGPLYALINGNAWVGGIISGGDSSINQNLAVRITQAVADELKSWRT